MPDSTRASTNNPENQAAAIELARLKNREGMAERLLAIEREVAALPVVDPRHPDDMLYDADGLPRE